MDLVFFSAGLSSFCSAGAASPFSAVSFAFELVAVFFVVERFLAGCFAFSSAAFSEISVVVVSAMSATSSPFEASFLTGAGFLVVLLVAVFLVAVFFAVCLACAFCAVFSADSV